MAFWDDVKRNVSNFFGGGNTQKKKKDEEEQRIKTAVSSAPPKPNTPTQQKNPSLQVKKPMDVFGTLNNTGTNPSLKPKPVQKTKQQELDELTEKNMDQALTETNRGRDAIGAVSDFFTGNDKKIARQNARNKAVSQYQEKNGWNADPEVMKYIGNTRELGNKTSKEIQSQGKTLDKVSKGADKVAQGIQYVPVAGSVFNLGLAANEKLANSRGTDLMGNSKDTARGMRNKVDFGMSNQEFDALDDETKNKLRTIQNVGLALSPLDFTGLGGLAKSEGMALGKKAALNVIKREAIEEATKQGLKTAVKSSLKTAVPATILGGGVSAGAQAYLSGEVDPLEALKAGLMTGGTSMLIPNAPNVSQKNLINNSLMDMADKSTINVVSPNTRGAKIPVVNNTPERQLISEMTDNPGLRVKTPVPIREFGGDTPGVNQVQMPTAADRFAEMPTARPDRTVEGMLPGKVEDTTLYTKAEVDGERAALNEALANGEINKTAHKAATAELDSLPLSDAPTNSTKINVREVQGIPVKEAVRDIPVDEISSMPNKVRVTDASAESTPVRTRQQAQAVLPDEIQAVLDNPKQFNKRQVQSARNQRKLANQLAKTKEQTAEAINRIDSVSPEAQTTEGFMPTGEFGKSANGGGYQKVSRSTERQAAIQETANLSPSDVIRSARETASQNGGGYNRRDIRNIGALFETKRIQRGTPEWTEARQILKEDGTNWGQAGALRNQTMRRNASADELISRFESKIYRLADDPSKIDGKLFDEVDAAETAFVDTRDAAMTAYNRFTEQPTSANAKIYHAAQDAAEKADKNAKMVEYKVANQSLKGNKDVAQARELEKMAQSADMYQMDAVDASMLSGTGTFVRNFTNAAVGGLEEATMGGVASRIASKITKQNVGGGFGTKSVTGFGDGIKNVVDASKARAGVAGKNPLEHAKNWATTGNQLGDSIIDGQVKQNVGDHYTQFLKDQGYKGRELRDRAGVMARQDPDNVVETYQAAARTAAGLGSGITRNNKVETTVKNIISDALSGGNPNKYTENIAKLVTRMTLGFPTAIGRSVAEGTKRFTLGAPTFIKAMRTSDPQARALLVKEGIKQAGSGGLVIPSVFYALGESGMITGSYPEDESERERWKREGITENSIKIGDDYYQLPAYLGSAALPALFYANLGRNGGDFGAATGDMAKTIPALLPTDQLTNVTDLINGRSDVGKFMAQTGASAVRAATPAGALFGQIAKTLDPTQNETNSGSVWENFIDKVINGVPIASMGLENKTDAEGNELANPDPLALALGASSTEQSAGVAQTGVLNDQTNSSVNALAEYGAFADPNLKAVITDEKTKKIYNDIIAGKQASPDDIKKLQEAMVKGVSSTGDDTAYLEKEQYDTNLTALNVKRNLMATDPTTKPSDLEKMDVAIKRGTIYRDNEIPYDLIDAYQTTGVDEWRKMGDPESDDYNKDMYDQLWAIDEMLTGAGVSYKKGALDKQKFSAKKSGSGGGRGGANKFSAEFGKLDTGTGAPSVQQYEDIDKRSGGVPVIQVQRPNIVHKIGYSG